jgi:hypothetical protein
MTSHTIKKTVTFKRPLNLSGFDGEQPAGSYSVETDEELLEGVSFPAYRWMATMMQLETDARTAGMVQVAVIDPGSLRRLWPWMPHTVRPTMSSPHGAR